MGNSPHTLLSGAFGVYGFCSGVINGVYHGAFGIVGCCGVCDGTKPAEGVSQEFVLSSIDEKRLIAILYSVSFS